ncbi:MAG: DMT family transporter [Thermoleophilia bacterium]
MAGLAMLCWGAAYVPSSWLVRDAAPVWAAALRLGAAGLIIIAVLWLRGGPLHPGVGWGTVAWLGLTQTALFYGATFWGIAREGAGLAAVLANTDPLFVAVLSALLLGEHLRPRQWGGLAVGFVGVSIAVSDRGLWPPRPSLAAVAVVAGAFAWGLGTITAARGVRGTANPFALAGWQMLIGAGMLGVAASGAGADVHPTARAAGLVLVLAVLGSAAPLVMFYSALRHAPAGTVSAWFFLVPIVGVASAWPLLGQTPTAALLVGMVGVSVGLWLVLAPPRRSRLVPSPPGP